MYKILYWVKKKIVLVTYYLFFQKLGISKDKAKELSEKMSDVVIGLD